LLKVLIFSLLVVYCNSQPIIKRAGVVGPVYGTYGLRGIVPGARLVAGGYGGYGYGGYGYGGYGGYGGLFGAVAAPVAVAAPAVVAAPRVVGPIPAAIQSYYTQEILPVQTVQEPVQPQIIEVGPNALPVVIHFQSASSPVTIEQSHVPGAPGEVQVTRSEDEPHRVVHEVVRPVIQEVKEIIQPYRRITQEIRPVAEEVHSIVAKGEGVRGVVAPAPVAAVAAAPVAVPVVAEAPVVEAVEEVAAPVVAAVAAPITTSIIRQPIGIVNRLGAGIVGAQRVLNGGFIKYAEY
jgi:hypothetical protein